MSPRSWPKALAFAVALLGGAACARPEPPPARLEAVAVSDSLWTGVAVSEDGRVFVCYPRWDAGTTLSVAEIAAEGGVRPYPDESWNGWRDGDPGVAGKLVCVQSVHCDGRGSLWALDAGNPYLKGVLPGAAKLVRIDLASNAAIRAYPFPAEVVGTKGYPNDVRIDARGEWAFVTDSGIGALYAVELATGRVLRRLLGHASTAAEDIVFRVEGREIGDRIHADGLAYDPRSDFLYYKALTGRTLYRVAASVLRDASMSEEEAGRRVERLAEVGPCDGLEIDLEGRIYLTALEDNAVKSWTPSEGLRTIVGDPRLRWPDSLARGPDGSLYLTISQLHLGADRSEPFGLFRIIKGKT